MVLTSITRQLGRLDGWPTLWTPIGRLCVHLRRLQGRRAGRSAHRLVGFGLEERAGKETAPFHGSSETCRRSDEQPIAAHINRAGCRDQSHPGPAGKV